MFSALRLRCGLRTCGLWVSQPSHLPHIARTSILEVITDGTVILFFGPLLTSGVALLAAGKRNEPSG